MAFPPGVGLEQPGCSSANDQSLRPVRGFLEHEVTEQTEDGHAVGWLCLPVFNLFLGCPQLLALDAVTEPSESAVIVGVR